MARDLSHGRVVAIRIGRPAILRRLPAALKDLADELDGELEGVAGGLVRPCDPGPMLKRLLLVWEGLRGERPMPAPGQIDPLLIPAALLPYVMLWEAVGQAETLRLRIRLFGEGARDLFPSIRRNKHLDEIQAVTETGAGPAVRASFRWVVDTGRPVCQRIGFWDQDRRYLSYARILLPFGADGRVERIMTLAQRVSAGGE